VSTIPVIFWSRGVDGAGGVEAPQILEGAHSTGVCGPVPPYRQPISAYSGFLTFPKLPERAKNANFWTFQC